MWIRTTTKRSREDYTDGVLIKAYIMEKVPYEDLHLNTYFYNEEGTRIGSLPGLLPVAVGTVFKIRDGSYLAESIRLVLDSQEEEQGYQVFCRAS